MRWGDSIALYFNPSLFEALYRESHVKLPGHPLHNQYINICSHLIRPGDHSPVFIPSTMYVFNHLSDVSCHIENSKQEVTPECSVAIHIPEASVTSKILAACWEITRQAAIKDLLINWLRCDNVAQTDVFSLSGQAASLNIDHCCFASRVICHLMQQVSEYNTLLHLNLQWTSLTDVTYLTLSNKPSLKYLDLGSIAMSVELCKNVCKQLKHIEGARLFYANSNQLIANWL